MELIKHSGGGGRLAQRLMCIFYLIGKTHLNGVQSIAVKNIYVGMCVYMYNYMHAYIYVCVYIGNRGITFRPVSRTSK